MDGYWDVFKNAKTKNAKINAALGAGMAALQGASEIYGIGRTLASMGDSSAYDNAINEINSFGDYGYSDYGQLASDYTRLSSAPDIDRDTLRGYTTEQGLGQIGSAMLAGAGAGTAIAPGLGTAIGAGVGLLGGVIGYAANDMKAGVNERWYNARGQAATQQAQASLPTLSDSITGRKFRHGIANAAGNGGRIETKQETLKEFADRVTRRQYNSPVRSAGIVRTHCKGGTMIRIKTK